MEHIISKRIQILLKHKINEPNVTLLLEKMGKFASNLSPTPAVMPRFSNDDRNKATDGPLVVLFPKNVDQKEDRICFFYDKVFISSTLEEWSLTFLQNIISAIKEMYKETSPFLEITMVSDFYYQINNNLTAQMLYKKMQVKQPIIDNSKIQDISVAFRYKKNNCLYSFQAYTLGEKNADSHSEPTLIDVNQSAWQKLEGVVEVARLISSLWSEFEENAKQFWYDEK